MEMRGESCDKKEDSDPRDTSKQSITRDWEEQSRVYRLNLQVGLCESADTSDKPTMTYSVILTHG